MACFIPSSSFSSFFSSSSSSSYYHHYFGAFKELLFFSPYNIAPLAFKQTKFFYRPSQQNMTTTPAMQRPYLPQRSYPSCSLRLPPCSRCSTPGPGGSSTPKSEAADSRSLLQRELATPRTRQQTTKGAAAMRPMRMRPHRSKFKWNWPPVQICDGRTAVKLQPWQQLQLFFKALTMNECEE